ncbi:MAG: hypothetical protein KOO62_13595 [candidate division Zixibacteria bacterium]|nr:hypothetical protein [candidate division Zixibacteria bacterium]
MKIRQGLIVFSIAVLFTVYSAWSDDTPMPNVPEHYSLQTAEEAVDLALKYTGFDKQPGYDRATSIAGVRLGTVRDSTTPFLSDSIDGRTAWVIEFKDVVFELGPEGGKKVLTAPFTFRVNMDAETGRFLGARFTSIDDESASKLQPSADNASRELEMYDLAKYHGIPGSCPSRSMAEALSTWKHAAPGSARLIVIHYVQYTRGSSGDDEPCPAWAVNLYGLGGGTAGKRWAMNAETGEFLWVVNWRPDN